MNKNGLITPLNKKQKAPVLEQLQHSPSCGKSTYPTCNRGEVRRILKWIVTECHPLRIVETATFRDMIAAASPDAVDDIWASRQSIHDRIISEYN